MENISLGLIWYCIFVFSITLHEACHALAAAKLGDKTAYLGGHVTLNPTNHIQRSVFGMVIVPIISYILGGWMIGWASVPYDRYWANRYPRRSAIMSLAGPAGNLLLVLFATIVIKAGTNLGYFEPPQTTSFTRITASVSDGPINALAVMLSITFTLNLVLLTFNLMPLPPLDGSGIIPILLPAETGRKYLALFENPKVAMIGIIIAWNIFGPIYRPVSMFALNLLYPGAQYH